LSDDRLVVRYVFVVAALPLVVLAARLVDNDVALVAEAMILVMWPSHLVFQMRRDHRLDDAAYRLFAVTECVGFGLFVAFASLIAVTASTEAAIFWLPLLLLPSYLPAAPWAIAETVHRYRFWSLGVWSLGALVGLGISHTTPGPALAMSAFAVAAHTIVVARFIVGTEAGRQADR
jgi:hypothetical protein